MTTRLACSRYYQYTAGGSRLNQEKVDTYGPLLVDLTVEKGGLKPQDVVDAARDPASPMHGEFTWDDTKAAHAHRLEEARALIREITITAVIGPRKAPVEIRLFHSTRNREGERSYGLVNILSKDEFTRSQIEAQALRSLIHWQDRLEIYQALPDVVKALEGLGLKERLAQAVQIHEPDNAQPTPKETFYISRTPQPVEV